MQLELRLLKSKQASTESENIVRSIQIYFKYDYRRSTNFFTFAKRDNYYSDKRLYKSVGI